MKRPFWKNCHDVISEQEKMLNLELDHFEEGLLANVFFSSDRLQHIFWVTRDLGNIPCIPNSTPGNSAG